MMNLLFLTNEATLVNGAFLFLLLQAVFRWAEPTILASSNGNEPTVRLRGSSKQSFEGGEWLGRVSTFFLRVALLERWVTSHHVPISNLYESLLFLAFLLCVGLLSLKKVGAPEPTFALASLCPLLILGFASFCLPPELQQAGPLVPALKSNWLLRHVTVRILAYAGLLLGSLLGVLFLGAVTLFPQGARQTGSLREGLDSPVLNRLDQVAYRLISFGFPFLTLGILSGAVWANETWGSYWSWDPKETWALITWLVFAVYLHTRLVREKTGVLPAQVASAGFLRVWICYLGVNLLGKGLHSYGWVS